MLGVSQAAVEAVEQEGRSSAPLKRIALRYQRRWRQGHLDTVAATARAHQLAASEHGQREALLAATKRADAAEERLSAVRALLQHGLELAAPDMQRLLSALPAVPTKVVAEPEEQENGDEPEEKLEDPRAFWAEEEESLLASLDSDQPLQASEEEAIYKRLAQIDALRQRHEEERAAFEKRAAARAARNAARAAAVGWAELRAGTVDGVEAQQRVLRSAAFVAGARQAGAVLSKEKVWSELSQVERRAAEGLGWSGGAWDEGRPAAACDRGWVALSVEEQLCAATLGWDHVKWGRIGGKKLKPQAEPPPPPAAVLPEAAAERTRPPRAARTTTEGGAESGWGGGRGVATDLDPAASLAGQLRFVSLSAEPGGEELVALFEEHEPQHLQALVTAEFSQLYAQWLADPVEQEEAGLAVAMDGHGEGGGPCAAALRFLERLLQAAVDLLDEVVLMDTPRPDVLRAFVQAYHVWFAEQIRQLCEGRAASEKPFADEMRGTLGLLGWVSQYEAQLAHYRVGELAPSVATITASTVRKFGADSEKHMRAWLQRILQNAKPDAPSAEAAADEADGTELCRSSVPRDLFAMLWEQLRLAGSTKNGALLLATVQAAVRVVNRWTAAECAGLSVSRPLDAICAVANNMEACVQHAAELIGHVQGLLSQTGLLATAPAADLGALSATFDDAYRAALLTLRDLVLADVKPLLKEVSAITTWRASAGMGAVLATVADYFGDFEPRLLPGGYRGLSAEVLASLLANYVEVLLLGFRHHAAIVKANAALDAQRAEDPLASIVGHSPTPLDPRWKELVLEQFQQDLTALKTYFREFVSDSTMRLSVGAVESLPMLLECEPTDFTQLVKEAAARSPQFSATLVHQVLDARHAGASSRRLLAECEKLIAAAADKHHCGRSADSPRLGGSGDGGGAVEAYDKLWSQLRNTERVAAASLGWDSASWVSVAAYPSGPGSSSLCRCCDRWDGRSPVCAAQWCALSPRQREAAKTLGYTAKSWDAARTSAVDVR